MVKPFPHSPAPPRFDRLQPVAELVPGDVADDGLVTGLEVAAAQLANHSCEFAELSESRLQGGTMADSDWHKPSWRDLQVVGIDAANVAITEGAVHRTVWKQSRMTGVVLTGSTVADTLIEDSILDLATMRATTLTRVHFRKCRMRGVDLSMATLTDVWFEDCDLTDAQLHQLTARARCRISGSVLDGVRGMVWLKGMTVAPADLSVFTAQLAAEMGIDLEW